jgi:hypothetical protein
MRSSQESKKRKCCSSWGAEKAGVTVSKAARPAPHTACAAPPPTSQERATSTPLLCRGTLPPGCTKGGVPLCCSAQSCASATAEQPCHGSAVHAERASASAARVRAARASQTLHGRARLALDVLERGAVCSGGGITLRRCRVAQPRHVRLHLRQRGRRRRHHRDGRRRRRQRAERCEARWAASAHAWENPKADGMAQRCVTHRRRT